MFRRLLKLLTLVLLTVVPGMESCVAATEDFLEDGYLSNAGRTNAEMKTALEQLNAAGKSLLGATAPATATISGDAISAAGPAIVVDTQGGAATDDLRTISTEGVRPGYAVMLWSASAARVVTLRHAPATLGGLSLAGTADYELGPDRPILLMLVGTVWKEIVSARGASAGGAAGMQAFIANGTFTVPSGITTVYVTAAGGGGGGGGGGGSGSVLHATGSNGSAGGTTTFNGVTVSAGGGGGYGGSGGVYGESTGGAGGAGGTFGGTAGMQSTNRLNPASARGGAGAYLWFDGNKGNGGVGGGGGLAPDCPYGGGGGGGGSRMVQKKSFTVTPGQSIAVVIGGGGSGGAGGAGDDVPGEAGATGTAGILIVEW